MEIDEKIIAIHQSFDHSTVRHKEDREEGLLCHFLCDLLPGIGWILDGERNSNDH